ncbi:hypothetical protein RRF57_006263 [Xylaria bambusicola]|uniref:Rrn9 domain-containing protein n=1 Tax=Xylaria bambusicola TaxID=326684 RepID=A0AAN7Z8U8_9PEZI
MFTDHFVMAYTGDDSDEYLPDSDDSNDSNERLNRWSGAPSTWQQLNNAEIDTHIALNEIRNQDLSIHLYNAFALKRRHDRRKTQDVSNPVPNQDINIATGQRVQDDKWVPPNAWTAWPLPAKAVPRPGFMGRTEDTDERLILRMRTPYKPKTELEETISAAMLRFAKERFQARQRTAQQSEDAAETGRATSDEEDSDTEMSSKPRRARSKSKAKSRSKSRPVKYESTSEGDMMDVDDLPVDKRSSPVLPEIIPLNAVVAADDELSYALLRPSAQGIIAKLDTTLATLLNAQKAKYSCPFESDVSDVSSRSQSRSLSRTRGPSNTRSQPPDTSRKPSPRSRVSSIAEGPSEASGKAKKQRGRPKKVYPRLDGETDREYAVRIARLRKERLPKLADDGVSDSTPAPNSAAEHTDNNEETKSKTRKFRQRRGSEALSDVTSTSRTSTSSRRPPRLARVRLRDWRDILGAAALAGFPVQALDRAARRCADLFGQGFTLHTLQEGPLDQAQLHSTMRYEPGMATPHILEDSEDEDDEKVHPGPRTRTSRALSAAASEGSRRGRSRSVGPRSMSRSRSASAGGAFFCIFSNCPRSVNPFIRRLNLIRHLRLVHMYDGNELPEAVDSQDEMHGAVHTDGFLKPIRIRPGWRGEDTVKGKRRPQTKVRGGEMADTRMRDTDSMTGYEEVSD